VCICVTDICASGVSRIEICISLKDKLLVSFGSRFVVLRQIPFRGEFHGLCRKERKFHAGLRRQPSTRTSRESGILVTGEGGGGVGGGRGEEEYDVQFHTMLKFLQRQH